MSDAVLLPDPPLDDPPRGSPARPARPTPGFMLGALIALIVVGLLAITYYTAANRDRSRAARGLERARVELDAARRARDGARQDLATQRRAVATASRDLTTARAAARATATRGSAGRAEAQSADALSRQAAELARRMADAVAADDVTAYNQDRNTYNDRFAASGSELARALVALQRRLALL